MNTETAAVVPETTTYDEVPYESHVFAQTHPRHLYALGRLFGLEAPDFRSARVLELGCAAGTNLLSMAYAYPESDCLGLDLSAAQIEQAEAAREATGIKNARFQQQDILTFDLDAHAGEFDYVVCHGVFSWVPQAVGDRILALCRRCLSDNGLALISYNALPGWNSVRSLREMMLFHAARFDSPEEKVAQARALLDFLAESAPESGRGGYRTLLDEERQRLRQANDSYLFHDHLETDNRQFYLHEFVDLAEQNELYYVGDASLSSMFVGNLPKNAMEKLGGVKNIVQQEQYMDFITNRRFRSTILSKQRDQIKRTLGSSQFVNSYLTASFAPASESNDLKQPVTFKTATGASFTTNNAAGSALALALAEAGQRPVYGHVLIEQALERLGASANPGQLRGSMAQLAMNLVMRGMAQLHADCPESKRSVSERPEAYPLARLQAAHPRCTHVSNIVHANVKTDPGVNVILRHFDGSRTLDEVAEAVVAASAAGEFTVNRAGQPVTDPAELRETITGLVPRVAETLAKNHLLVG